jgi:hypothetical protein
LIRKRPEPLPVGLVSEANPIPEKPEMSVPHKRVASAAEKLSALTDLVL